MRIVFILVLCLSSILFAGQRLDLDVANQTVAQIDTQIQNPQLPLPLARQLADLKTQIETYIATHAKSTPPPNPQELFLKQLLAQTTNRKNKADIQKLGLFYLLTNQSKDALLQFKRIEDQSKQDPALLLLLAYTYHSLQENALAFPPLETAQTLLNQTLPFRILSPLFCTNVSGYRIYEPVDGPLAPGQDVFIYLEIEGATFATAANGTVHASLEFGLEIQDSVGVVRWSSPNYGIWNPTFQNHVRDLQAAIRYRVPNILITSSYQLQITVKDKLNLTSKPATASLPFEVRPRTATVPPSPTSPPPTIDPQTLKADDYQKQLLEIQKQTLSNTLNLLAP